MSTPRSTGVDAPDPGLVRGALQRVLGSPGFTNSPRLAAFLTYVVEAALNGRIQGLKETTIGMDVYGRTPGYDPRQEPIVRTEARRLRAKLDEYYETTGASDLLRILLPKGGYAPEFELRPPSEPPPDGREPAPPPPAAPARSRLVPFRWAAAAGLVLAGTLYLVLHSRQPGTPPSALPSIRPLTSYRGTEIQPGFSPDGKQFAFVWDGGIGNFDIYIKLIDTGTPVRLTTDPGQDLFPAWSHDGLHLAFIRITPTETSLRVIPALGGVERKIAILGAPGAPQPGWGESAAAISRHPGPVWSGDDRSLVVADSPGAGSPYSLYAFNVDGTGQRRLTTPESGSLGDFAPAWSPDGRSLAFVRNTSIRGNASIYLLSSGSLRKILSTDRGVTSLAWINGRELLFSSNRSGPNMLWRAPLNGGPPAAIPEAGRGMRFISYSPAGGRVIYAEEHRNENVWRVPLKQGKAAGPPQIFLFSSRRTDSPEFSPAGDAVAFVSNRMGSRQIFAAKAGGDNPAQLSSVGPEVPIGTPRWSPDGRQIVYDTMYNGHSAIAVMNADGTQPHLVASDDRDNMMPSWSHDGRRIYFACKIGGDVQICAHPPLGGQTTRLTTEGSGGGDPRESPDEKVVYFGAASGIWQVPRDGGAATAVPGLNGIDHGRIWTVARDAIYFMKSAREPWVVYRYDLARRSISPVATIQKPPVFGSPGLAVSPGLDYLLFGQVDEEGSDIVMVEGLAR